MCRNWTLIHCWWECKIMKLLWKTVWQFLKRLKRELPYYPAISVLHLCPWEMKAYVHTKTCIRIFTAEFFIIAKNWKQPRFPLTNKQSSYIHIMGHYWIIKSNKVLIHATTWVNLEKIVLSERSQSQNATYCMMPFISNGQLQICRDREA